MLKVATVHSDVIGLGSYLANSPRCRYAAGERATLCFKQQCSDFRGNGKVLQKKSVMPFPPWFISSLICRLNVGGHMAFRILPFTDLLLVE